MSTAATLASIGDDGVLNESLSPTLSNVWIDRDVSWLDFNERVLAEALDERTPLLERAKFLAIFTSNLDEFFMKRAVVLLDVSRINSGRFHLEPIPCDLAALLRRIAEEFAAPAQHSGATLTVAAPDTVPGLWDRLAIEQIVDNLVSNAIKYGGRSPVELGLVEERDEVRLYVRDYGKGIPQADRRRIFGRFERAVGHDEYRSGFGVGLWVVGQLVEAMQGTITIDDAPGGGALFSVRLPKNKVEEAE